MVEGMHRAMWDRTGWRADLRKALRFIGRAEWRALAAKVRRRVSR
jgi:hypothetical protein